MSAVTHILSPDKDIKILKWVVHEGSQISNGSILCLYHIGADPKVNRLKNTEHCGLIKKLLHKDGALIPQKSPLLEIVECLHTTIIRDLCADCGADLQQIDIPASNSRASVPMIHSVPDLKVSEQLAKKIGRADTDRLLKDRKLVLLVDLDQTIIHTTNDNVPNNLKDVYHFQLYGSNSPWYHTRLRPGTIDFLKAIDPIFELHICTFGARNYAHVICGILDANGRFFSHRILSRDECLNATSKKDNLSSLFPDDCGDAMVCIIDDREDVWNHATNLIQVKPYHFFQHTGDINAPPGLAKRELDGKGVDFKKLVKIPKFKENSKTTSDKLTVEESSEKAVSEEKPGTEASTEPVPDELMPDDPKPDELMPDDPKPDVLMPDDSKHDEPKLEVTGDRPKSDVTKAEIPKPEVAEESKTAEVKSEENTIEDKAVVEDTKEEIKVEPEAVETKPDEVEDNLVEIQDPDDYLLYLETILKLIHQRFYETYDKTKEIPDLKLLVPQLKSEVLVGVSIVFSGLVPNIVKLKHSRPYLIAKNLGAEITEGITETTTHLVAASTGTQKVFQAQKNKNIQVVTPEWLWTCAERWEHVDEKLYPLSTNRPKQMRQIPAHCSPERVPESDDVKFNNPYFQMSDCDIASMEAEVEDSSSESDVDASPPEAERAARKRKRSQDVELATWIEHESILTPTVDLSGKADDIESVSSESGKSGKSLSDDDDSPSTKFRRGEEISSDLELDSNDSVDSVEEPGSADDDGEWNMMGAALEREFLGIDD